MPPAMPAAVAALPTTKDGHAVPFYAVCVPQMLPVDLDGQKVTQCYRQSLCGVCGKALRYWMVFLGGAGNRESRRFAHPPMHHECAEYLLAHDPFWSVSEPERTLEWEKKAASLGLTGALDWALYVTRGFDFDHRTRTFKAHAPKEIIPWDAL